jgi:hypothetical protein
MDLRSVEAGDYDLIVLPLEVKGHEGAPARAIMRKGSANPRTPNGATDSRTAESPE